MTENLSTNQLPSSLGQQLDEACDRFEAAWKAARTTGQRPRLEEYVGGVAETEAAALLPELILLDVHYRRRAGEQPRAEYYQRRFPALPMEWLRQAVTVPTPATATAPVQQPQPNAVADQRPLPGEAAQQLRCPHCHNPIQLKDERPDEVLCPACGSSFWVRDARATTTGAAMRPLGKFQLLERVGVGAFGAVWKARDTDLDRIVALKIPHAGLLSSKDDLERFHREARAAAQLRHPGIVTVHEVAILDGLPTLVADFIDGVPLKEFLQARHLTFSEAATLLADVAEALDYAHEMGLVHRDIKPANIMLEYRGAAADQEGRGAGLTVGKPLLMDFGLALRTEAEVTLTIEGQIIGTPAYMSPEQASGKGHQADRRSDVYSLGVVLYELLTGELPFRGSKGMMLLQVLQEEPRPPRRLNDKIPKDLETICLKALAKAPAQRYASARALAEDLRRWLAGEPIRARRVPTWERAWRWAKRRPAVAALVAVSVVAVCALVRAGVSRMYSARLEESFQRTQQARQEAELQRHRAQAALEKAEFHQYFHHIVLAYAGWRDGDLTRMEELLDACPLDRRRWEWFYLKRLCHADLFTLRGHTHWARYVAFSPDGTRLASVSYDRTAKLWDASTGRFVRSFDGYTTGHGLAFSPDGSRLASCGQDKVVRVWDVATGVVIHHLDCPRDRVLWTTAFSPDGKYLACDIAYGPGFPNGIVKVWDATTGQPIHELDSPDIRPGGVTFSPDGSRLAHAASGSRHTVRVWEVRTGTVLRDFPGHTDRIRLLAFSPDGTRLASASDDHTVKVWDAMTGDPINDLKDHTSAVFSVAFSPDGGLLASAGSDQTVRLWNMKTGQADRLIKGHTSGVLSVAFSPDGKRLASGGMDGVIKFWDVTADQEARTLRGHTQPVGSVAMSGDGKRFASASMDGTVRVWDLATLREVHRFGGGAEDRFQCVSFSPDGRMLAAARGNQGIQVWDLTAHRESALLRGSKPRGSLVAFSPDGTRLATAGRDGTVQLWDSTSGELVQTLKVHTSGVLSLAFSPDGTRLASASLDPTLKVCDTRTGELVHDLRGHEHNVHCVAFSLDGTRLASGGQGNRLKVWDARTGELVHDLRGHTYDILGVAFSPDGTRLASASGDGTVRLWDVVSGQGVLTLRGHSSVVHSVAFSPDGTRLISSDHDGTLRVWDATPLNETASGPVQPAATGAP